MSKTNVLYMLCCICQHTHNYLNMYGKTLNASVPLFNDQYNAAKIWLYLST